MTFHRVSDYCIRSGAWRICKVVVMGKESFEVWYGTEFRKRYRTAEKARAFVTGPAQQAGG